MSMMSNTLIEGLKDRIADAVSVNQSVGIILPGSNYNNLAQAIAEYIQSRPRDAWVYLTITKPYDVLTKQFGQLLSAGNIRFIDCVSRAAGISTRDPRCIFIDSPAQLEKTILEIVNLIKSWGNAIQKYVIIDSLSSLLIYNDSTLVSEFFAYLDSQMKLYDTHIISLCIEEEMDDMLNKILYLKANKIIKVRESFI